MFRLWLAALATTCFMIASGHSVSLSEAQTKSAEPETAKVLAGRETFVKNCLQCHATYEGQYSFGPNLYGEMSKPHPKKTSAEVRVIVKIGKGKMPPYADKLTSPDIENLIAYIHSL
jgi:mono/diheme cytochrome c family protein